MKKFLAFLLVLTLVLASISPAMAAKKPKKNFLFKGNVVSVGESNLVVEIEGGNRAAKKYVGDEVTFKVTDNTDIRIDGDEGELSEIEEDDDVMIDAKGRQGDQTFKARKINVMGGGPDDGPGGPGGDKGGPDKGKYPPPPGGDEGGKYPPKY